MSPAPGAERLKVVLDTNVYISAFQYPKGRNVVLWDAAVVGQFRLLVSPAIIQEMAAPLPDEPDIDGGNCKADADALRDGLAQRHSVSAGASVAGRGRRAGGLGFGHGEVRLGAVPRQAGLGLPRQAGLGLGA